VEPAVRAPPAPGTGGSTSAVGKFSFFVTSIGAMRELSKSQDGFGGDLRFGEATGLAGADKICRTIAEKSMPGAGQKTWRAFLSTIGYNGQPQVNAIDRIGAGPWYDRLGRVVAQSKTAILNTRPWVPIRRSSTISRTRAAFRITRTGCRAVPATPARTTTTC
jgi:hypothetical protein